MRLFHRGEETDGLLTIAAASAWASNFLGRTVTASNISYLVNYGRIRGVKNNGALKISVKELEEYYQSRGKSREISYKRRLGGDLSWRLSFEEYKEAETTKHVHRLHPYKGKFIPQLAEYFLDAKTDGLKTKAIFGPGDIVLDPFCGSGTTLVQANELGLHAIGADISRFNAMICNMKLSRLPAQCVRQAAATVERRISDDPTGTAGRCFERALQDELKRFNDAHFPADFRRKLRQDAAGEKQTGERKAREFSKVFCRLLDEFNLRDYRPAGGGFLDTWYLSPVKSEITAANNRINEMPDAEMRDMLRLILSRTARTARATTHYDLATLVSPAVSPYYCAKHGKVCRPLFSLLGWWRRYAKDTVQRLSEFAKLRTDTAQKCFHGDARTMNLAAKINAGGGRILKNALAAKKIRGIFSSPPYVGLINYHEQHAYAFEMFQYPRDEKNEIGILDDGQGRAAREQYARGVAAALKNCRRYMVDDFDALIVANDKFNLYPAIAECADMQIVKEYKRPVLNRAEGNKGAYGESIFHLRRK